VGRRLTLLFATKGMPVRSHARFFKRHGGHWWPFLVSASYLANIWRIVISSVLNQAPFRLQRRSGDRL
jgi:hypothetical protein